MQTLDMKDYIDSFYSTKSTSGLLDVLKESLENPGTIDEQWKAGLIEHLSNRPLSDQERTTFDKINSAPKNYQQKDSIKGKKLTVVGLFYVVLITAIAVFCLIIARC